MSMTKLTMCQTMMALGVNALIADGRLHELNSDGSSLASIGNEFYDGASETDLEGDIQVVDIDGRGFALVAASEMTEGTLDEAANGVVVETKADEPGLFWHEQIFNGDEQWIDAEE